MRLQVMALVGLAAIAGAGAYSWSVDGNAPVSASQSVVPMAAAPIAPAYRFTTVRFPHSFDSTITGINTSGAFVGNVVGPTGYRMFVDSGHRGAKPVFFTLPAADAVATTVATPAVGTAGTFAEKAIAGSVSAAGIDSAGTIVGNYADAAGVFHGFVRDPAGAITPLDVAGAGTQKGEDTEIAGISPGGVIVGSFIRPDKVAIGFIDRFGRVTPFVEGAAGRRAGAGTAVEFYLDGEFGGIYVGPGLGAHGWYAEDGQLHVVNDPAAGRYKARKGTQLVGVDAEGRLYGIESPRAGSTESFSVLGGLFHPIRDPDQAPGSSGGTLVLSVNARGTIVGFFTYNARGQTHGFVAVRTS
jgi:hypothetical protein